jgi:CubicO group peptidase (beta-lactamase class C family)
MHCRRPFSLALLWLSGSLLAMVHLTTAHAADPAAKRTTLVDGCGSGGARFAGADAMFEAAAAAGNFPGAIWGVVHRGRWVHCKTVGVADLERNTPVTADTVFRIASMTKSVTALGVLKLRDTGRLSLDDPAARWIPELPRPRAPGQDRDIRVRDLLGHTAGFVTDDPWGDRQLPLSEPAFTQLIKSGIPQARAPGVAYEYSNYGYALLGRITARAGKTTYQDFIRRELLAPLGMTASGFDPTTVQPEHRARGYRFEDGKHSEEPVLGDGAFASMGGMQTTANDYVRYLDFLLDAWRTTQPSRYEQVLSRATRRELAQPTSFPRMRQPDTSDKASCGAALAYSYGMHVVTDCRFQNAMTHSGGLPGYGSNVLVLPQYDAAVFLFANRTYAPAAAAMRKIAARLIDDGVLVAPDSGVSPALQAAAQTILQVYQAASLDAAPNGLAENLLLDRALATRNRELRHVRERLGTCQGDAKFVVENALAAVMKFTCERGTLSVDALLAPTQTPQFQRLEVSAQ